MAYEVFEEWFEGRLSRADWRELIVTAPGMAEFRHVMFKQRVPNLREIGLLSPRIQPAYQDAGLMRYFDHASAAQLSGEQLLDDLGGATVTR